MHDVMSRFLSSQFVNNEKIRGKEDGAEDNWS